MGRGTRLAAATCRRVECTLQLFAQWPDVMTNMCWLEHDYTPVAQQFGETNQSNIPGIAATQQDPSNSWAINAIEAGGRYLPHLGAAWLGINAGPIGGGMDTMDPAAAAMRQRMMRR